MSTTAVSAETQNRSNALSTALSVGAVFTTLGSLGYISMNGLPPREAYIHPVNIVSSIVATIGILILSLALMRWRTALPGWAVITSAAGVWFAGATAVGDWTRAVAAATNTDNELYETLFFESPWIIAGQVPKSLLCLVGFLGLAISGWRQRSIPRSAAIVLGVAGVISIWPPYPPGLILASLALFIIARAGASSRE